LFEYLQYLSTDVSPASVCVVGQWTASDVTMLREVRRKSLHVSDRTASSPSLTLPPTRESPGPSPLSVSTCPKARSRHFTDAAKSEASHTRRGSLVSGLSFFLHHGGGDHHKDASGHKGRSRTRSTSPGVLATLESFDLDDEDDVHGAALTCPRQEGRKLKERAKLRSSASIREGFSPPSATATRRGSFVHR
jgi:hypothetical protein